MTTAGNEQAGPTPGTRQRLASREFLGRILELGMIWAFLLVVVGGAIAYPRLIDLANIKNLLSQSAPVGIVAVGMTFVMIGGGFDLSVGAVFALSTVLFASTAATLGIFASGLLTLVVCAACGVVNGLVITKLRVNPFVATLGSGSVFGGAAYIYSNSGPVTSYDATFQMLGTMSLWTWPLSIWILLVIFLVGGFVLAKTRYGQSVYAIGGNNEASRLSGLPTDLIRASTYVLTSTCAGLGGMILASRLGVGQADMGANIALDTIAIVVIGGTSLLGGEGAMWRTAIGLAIVATLTNIFDSLAIGSNYQLVAKGIILIGAVALDLFARSLRQ